MAKFNNILRNQNFIDGKWLKSDNESSISVRNKYSGEEITSIHQCKKQTVNHAIASAEKAAREFKQWPAQKRREYLSRVLSLFREKQEEFIHLIVAEAGKPIGYAKGEVDRCMTTLELAIDLCLHFSGEEVNVDYNAGKGKMAFTQRFPIGPVACISPFNFPLNLALHKIAPALATGCPVVLKPSPYAPLSCLAFAAICEEAGYPAGFINVFLADIPEAELIVTDERLKLLSFTGSPQVGWKLKSIAGKKKVILELGGNAAVVVDETIDPQAIAKTLAVGSFLYAGQICISTQRIYVHEKVWEEVVEALIEETEKLGVGDPTKESTMVGPMIASEHLHRVDEWVSEAVSNGAKVLTGGKILDEAHLLYAPTLLTDVPANEKIVCEEAFGPVAILEKVPDFETGLQRANDTKFGLQAGVFTQRIDRMKQAFQELDVAGVIINNVPGFRVDGMPYGGIKESGLGREGLKYAMEDMTEIKLMVF